MKKKKGQKGYKFAEKEVRDIHKKKESFWYRATGGRMNGGPK